MYVDNSTRNSGVEQKRTRKMPCDGRARSLHAASKVWDGSFGWPVERGWGGCAGELANVAGWTGPIDPSFRRRTCTYSAGFGCGGV
jgi:hypothetical protein